MLGLLPSGLGKNRLGGFHDADAFPRNGPNLIRLVEPGGFRGVFDPLAPAHEITLCYAGRYKEAVLCYVLSACLS